MKQPLRYICVRCAGRNPVRGVGLHVGTCDHCKQTQTLAAMADYWREYDAEMDAVVLQLLAAHIDRLR